MTTERLRRLVNQGPASMKLRDLMEATEHEKREFVKLTKELATRSCEALRLYEPLPFQQRFHECRAKEALILKGNRSGGEQPLTSRVITPTGVTTIGELSVGDEVLGGDGLPCVVDEVIEYGESPVYLFTFSDGTTAEAGENHKWTCRIGGRARRPQGPHVDLSGWRVRTTDEIRRYVEKYGYIFGEGRGNSHCRVCFPTAVAEFDSQPVPLDPYTLGVLIGDGNFTHGDLNVTSEDEEIIAGMSLPDYCEVVKRDNISTRSVERYGTSCLYSIRGTKKNRNPAKDALSELGLRGLGGHEKFIPQSYIYNSIEVRLGILQGLLDTDGRCGKTGYAQYYTTSCRLVDGVSEIVKSLGGKVTVDWRENSYRGRPGRPLAHVIIVLPDFNPFRLSRKRNRRNVLHNKYRNFRYLKKVEYIGVKECRCINVRNSSRTYLTDNYIVTHNSVAGFVEDARAAINQDPFNKYPAKDGTVVCLGFGEKHIGRVIHKFLFRAGAFRIIRDLVTREWRVYRPWPKANGGDLERESESKLAPPLIPPRFIPDDGMVWQSRGDRVFSVCRLTTGWEIIALNSAGDPSQAQGFDVNLYHIDEDTAQPGWYEEAIGRTAIPKGLIRWTALPHMKNEDMLNMLQRSEDESTSDNPTTVCIRASMFDNPYYPEESRQANLKAWASQGEDVVRKRAYGEMVMDSLLVYPAFSKYIHTTQYEDEEQAAQVCKLLRANQDEPLDDWCLSMVVDPGHAVCAVTFWATPPPSLGDYRICYDELYLRKCDAVMFAEAVGKKVRNKQFERFIIDAHGGRLTEIGTGIAPQRQYENQLKEMGVSCNATKHYFATGSDDIKGREQILRDWMRIKEANRPKLLINTNRCHNLVRELERFKKKQARVAGMMVVTDDANRNMPCHAIETAEYAAADGLEYVAPRKSVVINSWVKHVLAGRKRREEQRATRTAGAGKSGIVLAPRGSK